MGLDTMPAEGEGRGESIAGEDGEAVLRDSFCSRLSCSMECETPLSDVDAAAAEGDDAGKEEEEEEEEDEEEEEETVDDGCMSSWSC